MSVLECLFTGLRQCIYQQYELMYVTEGSVAFATGRLSGRQYHQLYHTETKKLTMLELA